MKNSLTEIEQKLGYIFCNKDLLFQAFTHSSFANVENVSDNERMEFFGDAILEFISSEYLYNRYTNSSEGELSAMRAKIVSADGLAPAVDRLGLVQYLRISNSEGEISRKTKANLFEAVLCAIYLDGGIEQAKIFFEKALKPYLSIAELIFQKDAKTRLQEYCQKHKLDLEYRIVKRSGPDNNPSFTCELYVNGAYKSTGFGSCKKAAERDAANKIVTEWRID